MKISLKITLNLTGREDEEDHPAGDNFATVERADYVDREPVGFSRPEDPDEKRKR